jgi:hypothetical protein
MADSTLGEDISQFDVQTEQHQKEALAEYQREEAAAKDLPSQVAALYQPAQQLAKSFAASQQPFDQPQPQDQISKVMTGAPWLFALTAIGGKVSGAGGLAMLQGLNGVSSGIISGDQAALEQSWKQYNSSFDKWKANSDQQYRAYTVLRDAYGNMADGEARALEQSLKMTDDARQGMVQMHDPANYWKTRSEIIDAHARRTEAFARLTEAKAKAGLQGQYDAKAKALLAEIARLGVRLPGGRSQAERLATVQGLLERYPDKDPKQIAQDLFSGAINKDVVETEARLAGRREASISSAMVALNKPGGIYEQLEAAGKGVNFGDAKVVSRIELALQGGYVADAKIQYYATKLEDARAELAQVFTRTGQTTDAVRQMADTALPMPSSYEELQASIRASKEVAESVSEGNEEYIQALVEGKSVSEILRGTGAAGGGNTFSTEADAQKAADAGKLHAGDSIVVGGVKGTWQ